MKTTEPARVLIVDDEQANVRLLEALLGELGYRTFAATDGAQALQLAVAESPDLILLDIMMPRMDGFETVARLKADPRTQPVPVIMVTAIDDREFKLRALECGAEEFLTKPIDHADLAVRVRNLLRLKEYGDFLARHNEILEAQVRQRTAQLDDAYRDAVFTLIRAAEYKDEETGLHVRRIGYYCRELAEALSLGPDFCETIYIASPMHDVGKIGIPDQILMKPGPLSDEEWTVMRTHCAVGAKILAEGASRYAHMGAVIALNHHEHWDGSGYPGGLAGEAIPLAARIMHLCDVYDALRSRRPYKQAYDQARTLEVITRGDGRTLPQHFYPAVLAAFLARSERFAAIFAEHA